MVRQKIRMVVLCHVPRKYSLLRTETYRGTPWRSQELAYWAMASPMADRFGRTTSCAPSFSSGARKVRIREMLHREIAVPVRQLCGHVAREGDACRRTICNLDQAPALQ